MERYPEGHFDLTLSSFSDGEHVKHLSVNAERQAILAEACKKLPDLERDLNFSDPITYRRILADNNRKILYCVIPKNGCTSWKALMFISSGAKTLEQVAKNTELVHNPYLLRRGGLVYLSNYSIEEIRLRLKEYYKFVIYRHPIERLASAWYNKFVQERSYSTGYFENIYSTFGKRMVNLTIVPFNGFLEALVSTNVHRWVRFSRDKHWEEQFKLCHPCHIKYDYIAKVETMDTDAKVLLTQYNVSQLPALNVADHNVKRRDEVEERISRPNISETLSQLSPDIRSRIKSKLENDMNILGYSWEGYE